jgi:hypothetical protein
MVASTLPDDETSPVDTESVKIIAEALEKIARKMNRSKARAAQSHTAVAEPDIPVTSTKRCSNYLRNRFLRSGLWKLITGEGLSYEDADTAVNTFTLVAALLLTIPFSLVGNLSVEFWQAYEDELAACPGPVDMTFAKEMARLVSNILSCVTYACIGAIINAVFYYVLRPKEDDDFSQWWSHGRWGVLVLFILTATAVIGTMTLYGTIVGAEVMVRYPKDICNAAKYRAEEPNYQRTLGAGIGSIAFGWVVSILAML